MTDYTQIRSLFLRYMEGTLSADEREQLSKAAETYSTKEWEEILEPLAQSATPDQNFNLADWEKEIQYILSQPAIKQTKIIPLYRRTAFKWIAAASVIIIASLIFVMQRNGKSPLQVAVTHDVQAPSNTRAVITLANGSKVYLDSAGNGTIAQENNVSVVKNANGEIIYSHEGTKTQSITAYNTLFNPRGSKVISLTLSDGTKVWLNSESSLKYPIAFNGNTREVEITGEAYFDVKHNSEQPFKVHLPNGSIIEDIGTAFNINAYTDEESIKTTLVEGSIQISAKLPGLSFSAVKLKPGQQAIQTPNSKLQTLNPNIDEVTAWKNNLFQFTNSPIESIMKQVSRWYDVDVEYQGNIKQTFNGKIPRTVNASDLFKILESTGWVHFKIEGNKVIVSP